nr:MAG TPA: hypothetical protein [Caudoviricetes sp.]
MKNGKSYPYIRGWRGEILTEQLAIKLQDKKKPATNYSAGFSRRVGRTITTKPQCVQHDYSHVLLK